VRNAGVNLYLLSLSPACIVHGCMQALTGMVTRPAFRTPSQGKEGNRRPAAPSRTKNRGDDARLDLKSSS